MITTSFAMYTMKPLRLLSYLLVILAMGACHSTKKASTTVPAQVPLVRLEKDWLQYELYRQPGNDKAKGSVQNLNFSLRVINKLNNTSPLRRLCANMDEYNTYYEYLLNRAKEELYLRDGEQLLYPVAYSFENNYNAFPFETINIGYRGKLSRRGRRHLELVFMDRVFAHDTLIFTINHIK